ncbi:MAG: anthranilate phosphoribosyltransferase [Candidatus Ancillula sp.]|jgi:anthranilate phosphoribosyltransferase|nr:anthranilate phosphoribosyltransferase [Candidatus Ancillula sp.]
MTNWSEILGKLVAREDLDYTSAAWLMNEIMLGNATDAKLAAAISLLAAKGETVDELLAFSETMLEHSHRFEVSGKLLDIVGTGGDHAKSVNISSMASIVIAATGIKVLKHGNRAMTSSSGSADVLARLGVNLELKPAQVAEVIEEAGISFAFAQVFHPAMKYAAPVRKELEIQTIFNLLGPLTNPAQPNSVVIGVADSKFTGLLAEVFSKRGCEGFVFQGKDALGRGLDELAATAHGVLYEIRQVNGDGVIEITAFDPAVLRESVGLEPIEINDLAGGIPEHNAQVARDVFNGVGSSSADTKQQRAIFQTVVLNAAAGIVADGTSIPDELKDADNPFANLTKRFEFAYELAKNTILQGKAKEKLASWVKATTGKQN